LESVYWEVVRSIVNGDPKVKPETDERQEKKEAVGHLLKPTL